MSAPAQIQLAAWLVIAPADADNGLGIQRCHVSQERNATEFGYKLAETELAVAISGSIFAITGSEDLAERAVAAVRRRVNVDIPLGGGLVASITPAEPTSGVNLFRDYPQEG